MPADHARQDVQQRSIEDTRVGRRAVAGTKAALAKRSVGGEGTSGARTAIPVNQPSSFSLSPLLYQLPSLTGMNAFKGYLPSSSSRREGPEESKGAPKGKHGGSISFAEWRSFDFGDGRGKRLLLVISSPDCALRIFEQPSTRLPSDPDTRETFLPAQEICAIPRPKAADDVDGAGLESLRILSVELRGSGSKQPAEAIVLTQHANGRQSPQYHETPSLISLLVLDLQTGIVIRRIDMGTAVRARLLQSPHCIVVILHDRQNSTIHQLHPSTQTPLFTPIVLPPSYSLPSVALHGRLLAFATDEEPSSLGPTGYGSLIAANLRSPHRGSPSPKRPSHSASGRSDPNASNRTTSATATSAAILSSAAEYGGFAARGVFAGLRKGAQYAADAGAGAAGRLAKSAPVESGILADIDADEDGQGDARGESDLGEPSSSHKEQVGAERAYGGVSDREDQHVPGAKRRLAWIKVIDIARSGRVIAHFRLPRSAIPLSGAAMISPSLPHISASNAGAGYMAFNPDGTQLLVAQSDGRAAHVFQIHPRGIVKTGRAAREEAAGPGMMYHMYELKRGNSGADIRGVEWDESGRWIGLVSGHGTIHVFPVHPAGTVATAATHVRSPLGNPIDIARLSTPVTSVVRLRPSSEASATSQSEDVQTPAAVVFAQYGSDPLRSNTLVQDVLVFRPEGATVESARLIVTESAPSRHAESGPPAKQLFGRTSSDLSVQLKINARWTLPPVDSQIIAFNAHSDESAEPNRLAKRLPSLANAEIRTHSLDPRILPKSIYHSNQVAFYSARAIDDHSPLSIMDREARQHRLRFKPEIHARSDSSLGTTVSAITGQAEPIPTPTSFAEPLSTAVQSHIPSPPNPTIPGLPNGSPGKGIWSTSLPIRQAVGEGIDRVRNQYAQVKAQAARRNRQSQGEALSFEEGAVFPQLRARVAGAGVGVGDELDLFEDEHLPGLLSDQGTGSESVGTSHSDSKHEHEHEHDHVDVHVDVDDARTETLLAVDMDSGWGDRDWYEHEYQRAVQDEEPDDLVLGVMDEEMRPQRHATGTGEKWYQRDGGDVRPKGWTMGLRDKESTRIMGKEEKGVKRRA